MPIDVGLLLKILFVASFLYLIVFRYGSGSISSTDMLATGMEKAVGEEFPFLDLAEFGATVLVVGIIVWAWGR